MVEKLQKGRRRKKGLTKDINNMRAVMITLAPSLGEEGTKIIEYVETQMVLMGEENIKLFNEKKHISKKIPKKPSK